jgi:hypothetical protein
MSAKQSITWFNELSFSVVDEEFSKPITRKQQQEQQKLIDKVITNAPYSFTYRDFINSKWIPFTRRARTEGFAIGLIAGVLLMFATLMIADIKMAKLRTAALRQSNAAAWDLGFITAHRALVRVLTVTEDFKALSLPMYSNESIENPYTVTNKPPGYLRLAPITNQ